MSPILDLTPGDVYEAQRQDGTTLNSNGSSTLLPKLIDNWNEKSELQQNSQTSSYCTRSPSESRKKGTVRLSGHGYPLLLSRSEYQIFIGNGSWKMNSFSTDTFNKPSVFEKSETQMRNKEVFGNIEHWNTTKHWKFFYKWFLDQL